MYSVPFFKYSPRVGRHLSFTYLVVLLVLLALSGSSLAHRPQFESNILALLPEIYRNPQIEASVRKQAQAVASKVIVVVRSPDVQDAQAAAVAVAARMRESGLFAEVEERVKSARFAALKELFLHHPFQLASPPKDLSALLEEQRQQAFSPEGMLWLQSADRDPLLLLPGFLQSTLDIGSQFTLQNGFIHVSEPQSENVLIFATLRNHETLNPSDGSISGFFGKLPHFDSASVHSAGLVFFAEQSASRTKHEVTGITSVTLALLVLVLLAVFRSFWPVALISVCIGSSFIIAVYLGEVMWKGLTGTSLHLITIGFGSSLLGVSIDYALHYLIALRTQPESSRGSPLSRIKSGLIFGFVTTALGFLSIGFSPFPGLRQLAIFCIVGLLLALLFVFLLLPLLAGRPAYDHTLAGLAERVLHLRSRFALLIITSAVIILCVIGLPRVRVVDDIRVLHNPSEELVKNQRETARLAGFSDGSTVLIVQGNTEEQLLRREESLRPLLVDLTARGELQGYRAISRLVPSQQLQEQRYRGFAELVRSNPKLLEQASEDLHLPRTTRQIFTTLSTAGVPPPVTISQCMSSMACDSVRDLWIGPSNGKVLSIIALNALTSRNYSQIFDREGVTAINQADAISHALKLYRASAIKYTGYIYLCIFLLLFARYGLAGSLRVSIPSIIGSLAALSALGLAGVPINVFSVFALIVLLGVSIDYSIFFAEDTEQNAATGLSVLLSAVTTALSFGLLSFSSTPALQSFGIVLSVGCVVAALAAQGLSAIRH